ncbi:gamma-glutamyl-gamma-aminobutyrate hydrolase family protein [Pseudomonas sp. ABC1]|uniref:gamma-glutamyl-gamma-aminobutyrate hydrolase family protein n=1 Tax=Pseudomonas sp. ABC1 TaxID=2748080 RepID=UPI0015C30450|nr:gamma-glutamyl-gamma-aminobutyrate hydrolase family protein [Pseudomonas sp. ABC1]QLF93668.1 gamma-glutamyl-gamma-aminobutyrate hydrolase family protein [Pseudomonas sp. ABC1]
MTRSPLIGVSACSRKLDDHDFHIAGDKYLRAAALEGLPLVIPTLESLRLEDLLAMVDGLLFTGSPSNVEPLHYRGPDSAPGTLHDRARDDLTLPLIRAAVDAGIPVFGICRGFQEMNVAFGGSLHQKVHELPGYLDHREDPDAPLSVQYGFSHDLLPEPGGLLERLGVAQRCQVNSLHSQGIDRLGEGLRVEARAPDGLIEAISVESARTFALGVQWHPEWNVQAVPHYLALFRGFADACRLHAEQR